MISLKRAIIAATVALAASGAAFADGHAAVSKPTGLYLDGGVGANFLVIRTRVDSTGPAHTYNSFSKLGVNANLGYKLNDYVAPELGYTNYGIGLQAVDAAVKGFLPLNVGQYGANLIGKVGVSHIYDTFGDVNAPLVGVGFDYGITRQVSWNVNAQAVLLQADKHVQTSTGLLSTGLTYYFG